MYQTKVSQLKQGLWQFCISGRLYGGHVSNVVIIQRARSCSPSFVSSFECIPFLARFQSLFKGVHLTWRTTSMNPGNNLSISSINASLISRQSSLNTGASGSQSSSSKLLPTEPSSRWPRPTQDSYMRSLQVLQLCRSTPTPSYLIDLWQHVGQ